MPRGSEMMNGSKPSVSSDEGQTPWSKRSCGEQIGHLSMNRTNSEYALPSKAAEDRRTPRRYRVGDSRAHFRQVLECAGPAALWIAQTGSWSQSMRRSERGLSMNRTNFECTLASKAEQDFRTPR